MQWRVLLIVFLCSACEREPEQSSSVGVREFSGVESLEGPLFRLLELGNQALLFEDYVRDAMRVPGGDAEWGQFADALHLAVSKWNHVPGDKAGVDAVREDLIQGVLIAAMNAGDLNKDALEAALRVYTSPQSLRVCKGYFASMEHDEATGAPELLNGPLLRRLVRERAFLSNEHLMRVLRDEKLAKRLPTFAFEDRFKVNRARFALSPNSDSTQSSLEGPRILLFGENSDVALGITGVVPADAPFDDIEVSYNDCLAGRKRFALIRFDTVTGKLGMHFDDEVLSLPVIKEGKVTKDIHDISVRALCVECHAGDEFAGERAEDAHDNWYDYDSWDLYGAEHQEGARTNQEDFAPDGAEVINYPNAREKAALAEFLQSIDFSENEDLSQMSRYALVLGMKQLAELPKAETYDALAEFNTAIDYRLHKNNGVRVAMQVARAIENHPDKKGIVEVAGWTRTDPNAFGEGSERVDLQVVEHFAKKLCEHIPTVFATRCAQGTLKQDIQTFAQGYIARLIEKTGRIREYFYEKAIDSFPMERYPNVDEGIRTLEEAKKIDTVQNAGLSSYDYYLRHRSMALMFLMKELGISTKHWAMTPKQWGESYQFVTEQSFQLLFSSILEPN